MLLWWGWYGFNVGSTLGITWVYESSGTGASEAGLVLINTTLAPSAAGLTAMVIKMVSSRISEKKMVMSVSDTLNGILAGLVSITAGCGDVRPWAAVMIGFIGGIIYQLSSKLQKLLKIDDVVDAGPVHFWCGMWGVIAIALFADDRGTGLASKGGFYGGGGTLLGNNLILIISIVAWVTFTMVPTFFLLRVLRLARVSAKVEDQGMDISKHGVLDGTRNGAMDATRHHGVNGQRVSAVEAVWPPSPQEPLSTISEASSRNSKNHAWAAVDDSLSRP